MRCRTHTIKQSMHSPYLLRNINTHTKKMEVASPLSLDQPVVDGRKEGLNQVNHTVAEVECKRQLE
eukprot:3171547-Amphidinium_carterae.1